MRKGSAIMIAGAIVIGGCGGGDDNSEPTRTETPTAEVLGESTVAPTTVVTEQPAPETTTTYTVVAGDTLGAIAQRFGVSVEAIAEASGITDVALIHIGQELRIPSAPTTDAGSAGSTDSSGDG